MDYYFDRDYIDEKLADDDNFLSIKKYDNNFHLKLILNENDLYFEKNNSSRDLKQVYCFLESMENQYLENNNECNNNFFFENDINFPIKSETDNSIYLVSLIGCNVTKNLKFRCSCGLKFKIGYRKKCKHIKSIILTIKKKFSDQKDSNLDKLTDEISCIYLA